MKINNKWYTIVELIIVVVIIWIISRISYISINMIWESNIRNRDNDISVFINWLKNNMLQNKYKDIYLYLSNSWSYNKYLFSYWLINDCNNINVDDLFYKNYILSKNTAYFTWSILSWSISLSQNSSLNNFSNIITSDLNKTHNINTWDEYLYNIYWSWKIIENDTTVEKYLKCWDIKVFFLDKKDKSRYYISDIKILSNNTTQYKTWIILKYKNNSIKPDYYENNLSSQRGFYDKIIINLKDDIENLAIDVEI